MESGHIMSSLYLFQTDGIRDVIIQNIQEAGGGDVEENPKKRQKISWCLLLNLKLFWILATF